MPNCVSYDPAFAYELAVIVQDGLRRMVQDQESVFYYITTMNENYVHPPMPKDSATGILKGLYPIEPGGRGKVRVQLIGSGTILREVQAAAELLKRDYQIPADIWSATSFNELRRDVSRSSGGISYTPNKHQAELSGTRTKGARRSVHCSNRLHEAIPDQIQRWVPGRYITLGTDGFGRSDARAALRDHFEVNRYYIAVTALKALADEGAIDQKTVSAAMDKYGIDADKPDPVTL